MCVATVDASGQPSQRLVLLKDVNSSGFTFYTNLGSRKASELAVNPKVSLHFPWHPLERQVIVRPQGEEIPFDVQAFRKYCLLNGFDDIGLTMEKAEVIDDFEAGYARRTPWLAAG